MSHFYTSFLCTIAALNEVSAAILSDAVSENAPADQTGVFCPVGVKPVVI